MRSVLLFFFFFFEGRFVVFLGKFVKVRSLAFLQLRLEMKLALSTVKGRVSAFIGTLSKTACFAFPDPGLYTGGDAYSSAR